MVDTKGKQVSLNSKDSTCFRLLHISKVSFNMMTNSHILLRAQSRDCAGMTHVVYQKTHLYHDIGLWAALAHKQQWGSL